MPRSGPGPEEFFEVFREVQEGRKRHDDRPPAPAPEPVPPRAAERSAPSPFAGTLTLSYVAAGSAVVIALLLVVLAYLLGREHGWRARGAGARTVPGQAAPKPSTRSPVPEPSGEPEIIDGKMFTLLTLRSAEADRDSALKEAAYLNAYVPFRALELEAYVCKDSKGRYRLCARGFKGKDEAAQAQARDEIRGLQSRHGRREYHDADFLVP